MKDVDIPACQPLLVVSCKRVAGVEMERNAVFQLEFVILTQLKDRVLLSVEIVHLLKQEAEKMVESFYYLIRQGGLIVSRVDISFENPELNHKPSRFVYHWERYLIFISPSYQRDVTQATQGCCLCIHAFHSFQITTY